MSKKESTNNDIGLFGFLEYPHNIYFEGGCICLIDKYEESLQFINELIHKNGFFYPPEVNTYTIRKGEEDKKVPHTRRPVQLYHLPPSHNIIFEDKKDYEALREYSGAFIIYILSYLFNTHLQFWDWRVSSKTPIRRPHFIIISKPILERFLSYAFTKWKRWDRKQQIHYNNLLFMHSRAPSYQWEWERFMIEYMVFDGLYDLTCQINQEQVNKAKTVYFPKKNIVPHKGRFQILCEVYDICYLEKEVDNIYKLRNELFHKAMYGGAKPGFKSNSQLFTTPFFLRQLNQRILPATLEYKNKFINDIPWNIRGVCSFK